MTLMQSCRFILYIVSTAILARLLTPDDFGLFAMVVTVTGLAAMFRDMGLSTVTIQKDEITHEQISTLFWVNLAFSSILTLITFVAAPVFAWFYHDARIVNAIRIASVSFICGGLTVQHDALLRRQMRFSAVAVTWGLSMLIGAGVGIIMAWKGFGYWSLIGKQLAEQFFWMVCVWLACSWRPGKLFRLRRIRCGGKSATEIRSMLKFGFNITGSNILTYLMRNIDNILIGGSWHTVLLGIYAKAYELLYFPILQISGIVTNVAIPVLSRLQSDSERFRNYFIRGLSLITACAMPVMVLLFVAADKVVIVLLGDQWFEVIPVMVLLGPASFVWTFTMASGWVFISTGRADRFMRWQIIGIVLTTSAFVIGLRWGAVGIAGACSLVTAILQYPAFVYCFRGTPLKVRDVGLAIWRPSFASLIAGVTTVLFNRIYALGGNTVARLATDVFCFGLIYLLSCWILPGGRRWFADIFSLTSDLKANKRS